MKPIGDIHDVMRWKCHLIRGGPTSTNHAQPQHGGGKAFEVLSNWLA